MRSNHRNDEKQLMRKELKFCEWCGGLWVRECGAGVVYCDNCAPEVADLPMAKKRSTRARLPVGSRNVADEVRAVADHEESFEFEAVGGVA